MAVFGATRVFDRMKVSDPVWVAFIFAGLIVPAILYRYVFVFQQFAIAPGSGTDFFDRCVRQANQVWKTAVLLSTGESLTILLIGHAAALIKRQEAHSARTIAVDITTCIVTNCFSVWLILLRTELAQQLGAAAQRGVTGDEPMITGEPSPA
jgi:hypothetical protein